MRAINYARVCAVAGRATLRRIQTASHPFPSHTRAASTSRPTLVSRGFNVPTPADLSQLSSLVGGASAFLDGASPDATPFFTDWTRQHTGSAAAVLLPSTSAQVAAVLAFCSSRRLAVVPQGGNTGLVHGGVPLSREGIEVVLSLKRLARVHSWDAASGVLVAEAGAVLETLDTLVGAEGWTVPLDLGSKGSAAIGGNIATAAGGLRFMRFGPLSGSVLGLEVVTGAGAVLGGEPLCTLRKDNVGLKVGQLFIGSEGTLGVITRVAIQCAPRSRAVSVALLGCAHWQDVLATLTLARARLGEILAAAEVVDAEAMDLVLAAGGGGDKGSSSPLSSRHAFNVLLETGGSNASHDAEKLESFLTEAMGGGVGEGGGVEDGNTTPPSSHAAVTDGVVAASDSQARALWRLREGVTSALSSRGLVLKYDLSYPSPRMYDVVEATRDRLESPAGRAAATAAAEDVSRSGATAATSTSVSWTSLGVRVVGFGHLADGNIHLNVSLPGRDDGGGGIAPLLMPHLRAVLEPWVFEWTLAHGGSVSAEHGLGASKADWLHRSRGAADVAAMLALKKMFDPSGILNPGKLFPLV